MSLSHIRGVQPSKVRTKKGLKGSAAANRNRRPLLPCSGLHKNIQKIVAAKKRNDQASSSFGINRIMDQTTYTFFMDYCTNVTPSNRIPINTSECFNFLSKHNIKFHADKNQEISNSKTLLTTVKRKKNNTTFTILLPVEYSCMLIILVLIKIDFGGSQVEFTPTVGRMFEQFMYKAKQAGFKFYYDFIRLNIKEKRFNIVRN